MSADPQLFPDNFFRLTGHSPMRWQHRLFDQFINEKIPATLDLPTGLGKTSVMAIWLLARASAQGEALKAIPRRLVYIVDRRAVVDQATAEAEMLRDALDCNDTPESKAEHLKALDRDEKDKAFASLREIKACLKIADGEGALPISTLRGQYADNKEWLADPASPAIIVGTVDMTGSRLLFEGYGVSRKMRPYHAGLLGADALIVLDEAHLVRPFQHLLAVIEDGKDFLPQEQHRRKIVPRLRRLSLSATQPEGAAGLDEHTSFTLEPQDLADNSVAKQRVEARKTLHLEAPVDKWDAALAERSWVLAAADAKPSRVVVFCTRRDKLDDESSGPSVMGVQAEIERKAKQNKTEIECEILVGGRRVRERKDAAAQVRRLGFAGGDSARSRPPPDKPTFLLATSAGEVGVDFDADHMVSDLAPWERMVQRLGRVNRRGGEMRQATVAVFDTAETEKKNEDRKTRLANTLALLRRIGEGGSLSSADLAKLGRDVGKTAIREASTPEPLHPALTRAVVDAWSMTSLEQHTGRPDVAPWLRGWVENDQPQAAVVWRRLLPVGNGGEKLSERAINEFFDEAPPQTSEALETETWRVVEWLLARVDDAVVKAAKASKEIDASSPLGEKSIVLFVLNSKYELDAKNGAKAQWTLGELDQLNRKEKKKEKDSLEKGLAGRSLVVSSLLGGLNAEGMLDAEAKGEPSTLDNDETWQPRPFRVVETSEQSASADEIWRETCRFATAQTKEGEESRWIVVEERRNQPQSESDRSIARFEQTLKDHQGAAERIVRDLANALGLPSEYSDMLALAARLHDEGKRAQRWQRAFNALHDGKVYAKTKGPFRRSVLDGYRHEFGSLPPLQDDVAFKALPPDLRELALHLVAAHHGGARPVISTDGCQDGPPTALEERACEVALHFAQLQKRWGPWGLAWWESLLRAADQQASRDNDKGEGLSALHTEET